MKLVNTLCNKLFLLKSAGYEYTTAISEKDQVQVEKIVKLVLEEKSKKEGKNNDRRRKESY